MRLVVVGSVNVTDHQKKIAEDIIIGFLVRNNPEIVISGGALGIDELGIRLAREVMLLETRVHLPENNRWAPNGYQARNIKISEDCTHLLCIRTQQSTTYGSGWTADHAERSGKTVWRVLI